MEALLCEKTKKLPKKKTPWKKIGGSGDGSGTRQKTSSTGERSASKKVWVRSKQS